MLIEKDKPFYNVTQVSEILGISADRLRTYDEECLVSPTRVGKNENNLIPVVRIRDILDNTVSAYSSEKVDDKYKLLEKDLIIGMDGNFHMNFWKDNNSYLNQRSVRIRKKKNVKYLHFKHIMN